MDGKRHDAGSGGGEDDLLGEALGRFGKRRDEGAESDGGLFTAPVAEGDEGPLIAPPKREVKRAGAGGPTGGRNVRMVPAGSGWKVLAAAVAGGICGAGLMALVVWVVVFPRVVEPIQALNEVHWESVQKKAPPGEVTPDATAAEATVDGGVDLERLEALAADVEAQLAVLKVRGRLADLADRAIVLGERTAYQQLRSALSDDEHADSRTAVRSELLRVEYFYASGSRLKGFVLPVAELFPGEGIENEEELSAEQVIGLLKDHQNPWQVRARSAWLLGAAKTPEVAGAVVEAMLAESNLDVMKECQYTFEETTGFRAVALFDTVGVEAWWEKMKKEAEAGTAPAPEGE